MSETNPSRHIDKVTELIDETLQDIEPELEQLKQALKELEEADIVLGWARHLEA